MSVWAVKESRDYCISRCHNGYITRFISHDGLFRVVRVILVFSNENFWKSEKGGGHSTSIPV